MMMAEEDGRRTVARMNPPNNAVFYCFFTTRTYDTLLEE